MLKKILFVAVVGFAVAACNPQTTGGNVPVPPPSSDIGAKAAEVIGKVQETTTKLCSYVPTAQTVANILGALGVSSVSQLTDVASQICGALDRSKVRLSHPLARRAAPPSVAGVPIRGRYVR